MKITRKTTGRYSFPIAHENGMPCPGEGWEKVLALDVPDGLVRVNDTYAVSGQWSERNMRLNAAYLAWVCGAILPTEMWVNKNTNDGRGVKYGDSPRYWDAIDPEGNEIEIYRAWNNIDLGMFGLSSKLIDKEADLYFIR